LLKVMREQVDCRISEEEFVFPVPLVLALTNVYWNSAELDLDFPPPDRNSP